jgi:hypothetical protein
VSDQLRAPVALCPGKDSQVPIKLIEFVRAKDVLNAMEKRKILASARNQTSAVQPATRRCTTEQSGPILYIQVGVAERESTTAPCCIVVIIRGAIPSFHVFMARCLITYVDNFIS